MIRCTQSRPKLWALGRTLAKYIVREAIASTLRHRENASTCQETRPVRTVRLEIIYRKHEYVN